MSNGEEITRRLADLLREPRESLEVELKEWLDITGNTGDRARLAKELIALANHGGGYLLIGFAETEQGNVPAEPRPANLSAYTPDTVNSVVSRFAEPPFHCDVRIVPQPDTGLEFPIVIVPGGHKVPIRSKSNGPNNTIIQIGRYYIRRPGPASEPPQSGQEWDTLIRRCLANARDELLDQFRILMAGGVTAEIPETDLDRVIRWFEASMARWHELVETVPAGSGPRMEHGHYAAGYQIIGDFEPPRGGALRETLAAGVIRHTGWPPFWVPTREGIEPYMYEGNVECWLGQEHEGRTPAHSDFWRVSPLSEFFVIRGYQEDSGELETVTGEIAPGSVFDITLPVWRVGEILLHAASMARQLGAERTRVAFVMEWTGLADRGLVSFANPMRLMFPMRHISRQDTYQASLEVQANQIEDSLPELVARIVLPLFELFDFFQPPAAMIHEELARMRSHRF